MSSEGACPDCGSPLGISGHCNACGLERAEAEREARRQQGPRCKQCGSPMVHSRLYGYHCAVNREHTGIVWLGREETP